MKLLLLLLGALALVTGCSSGSSSGGGGSGGAGGAGVTSNAGGAGGAATTDDGGGGAGQAGAPGTGGGAAEPTVHLTIDPTTMKAGDTVTATVAVTHFVLEAPEGQPNQPGHGHYHIYLDQASGIDYLIANQTPTIPVQVPPGTTVGAHTLRVSLGNNDHSPLAPPVEDHVDITVVAP
jgi:hypothetical protein